MTTRNPALEAELRAHPGDTDRWLVWADWLTERGDGRGEVVAMAHRLRTAALAPAERADLAARYARQCRAIRWPEGGPWPPMDYRARFEALIDELRAHPAVAVRQAAIGPPTDAAEIARWRAVAGAAWPDGMDELYAQLSSVDVEWNAAEDGDAPQAGGAIHLPPLGALWDYEALDGELWFDFLGEDHPFHRIRPVDRFAPEAYAVLYPVPPEAPATEEARVAYHYCGESLVPTRLTYRAWLELLFRSRGVAYWLTLAFRPFHPGATWVEDGIARAEALFPDFDPASMSVPSPLPEVDT